MGAYDSRIFSQEFSKRTEANLEYITRIVNKDETEKKLHEEFLDKYAQLLSDVSKLADDMRTDAKDIGNAEKKDRNGKSGKTIYSKKVFELARKLDTFRNSLEYSLKQVVATGDIEGHKLYEVTQLLNSLMGIAVLPYEMHKEYFKRIEDANKPDENIGRTVRELQDSVKECYEYDELKKYILDLYREKKWITKYPSDLKDGIVNEETVVFRFLGHLRNVTCHSGDNAMSILPLTEGKSIHDILFYDHMTYDDGTVGEFAMWLSVEELRMMVDKVADFYRNSKIGDLDKTKVIEAAEKRVADLLNKKLPSH